MTPAMPARTETAPATKTLERGAAFLLLGLAVFLHAVFLRSAGALWRDEVNGVNLAALPPREFWANLQFDSFPAAWFALVRAWTAAGWGASDAGLRALGLLLGLGVLAALWRNARRFGATAPLFSLALLGVNAAAVRYGDSVRAHGLGMLAGLVAFGMTWEAARRPTPRRAAAAAAAGLVAVHCVYYNAVFLLAACAGGVAVRLRRKDARTAPLLAAIGLPAALSLLVYRGVFRAASDWIEIVRWPVGLPWIWSRFDEACRVTSAFSPWLWLAALAACAAAAAAVLLPREVAPAAPEDSRDAVVFCAAALAAGLAAAPAFLLALSYTMQPWYFLSFMTLAATCADGILLAAPARGAARAARPAAALLAALLVFPGARESVGRRCTNLDLAARSLAAAAGKGDLIVLAPWHFGISFSRYYAGAAPWTTVPPVSSHDLNRLDLLKGAMEDTDVMRPVLARIESVLRGGGSVYWVGDFAVPPEGRGFPVLLPAPEAPWGWREGPYYVGWTLQAGYVLRERAANAEAVPIESERPVSAYENPSILKFSGGNTAGGR